MDKKNTTEEKTREEVEAERKAKRAAKQDRKKAALEKHKSDGPDTQNKPVDQPLESAKIHKTKESKPVSKTNGTYFSFNGHRCFDRMLFAPQFILWSQNLIVITVRFFKHFLYMKNAVITS